MALFRYPGGKGKLLPKLREEFPSILGGLFQDTWDYREPFFGAGGVGFDIMRDIHPDSVVWINDIDPGIVAVWESVQLAPEELKIKIRNFEPSVENFYLFRNTDGSPQVETVERGFRKVALHQMSMSGFGAKSGGPIGGKGQKGAYTVDCRWNPANLCKAVDELHRLFWRFATKVKITQGDFQPLVMDCPPRCFVYLDPPYVEQGEALYKYGMATGTHHRLADAVSGLFCSWALSYDDHPLVRELYTPWAHVKEIETTYTNAVARGTRPPKKELLIIPYRAPKA